MDVKYRIKLGLLLLCFPFFTLAKQPIIIDTDLGQDDWAAIAYLMNQSQIDIKAITIEGSGETDCQHGVPNLKKVLQYWHRTNIPIACNGTLGLYKTKFPVSWRNPGSRYFSQLNTKNPSPVTIVPNPAGLINSILKKSSQPVTIIAIGPLMNLLQASRLNRKLWLQKVKAIYFTGGNFTYQPGEVAKYYPKTKNIGRSWNLFITPYAGSQVFKLPLNLTFNSTQTENQLNPNDTLFNAVSKLNSEDRLNKYSHVAFATQQKDNNFWGDALTAVIFIHPNVCQYRRVNIIILYKTFLISGVSKITSHGKPISYCNQLYMNAFINSFVRGIIRD